MSEIEDLRREVRELREQMEAAVRHIRWQAREQMLIEEYLEGLTSRRHWGRLEKAIDSVSPYGWLHPLRVLSREPFSVWADNEREKRRSDDRGLDSAQASSSTIHPKSDA